MRVRVVANKRDHTRRLAFIDISTSIGVTQPTSIPAYFPKELTVDQLPEPETEIEVMICGVLSFSDANGYFDFSKPKCLFIRQPTTETLVTYNGFNIGGSMAQTLSTARDSKGRSYTISPGKLMDYLPTVEDHKDALTPGVGWISHNAAKNIWRLEGVKDPKYLTFARDPVKV